MRSGGISIVAGVVVVSADVIASSDAIIGWRRGAPDILSPITWMATGGASIDQSVTSFRPMDDRCHQIRVHLASPDDFMNHLVDIINAGDDSR
jgi:hypothetical protein